MIVRRLSPLVLLLALVIASCGSGSTATVDLVSPTEAVDVLDELAPDVVLLDVRTAEEYADGHVAGSVNVDFYDADFAEQLDELTKDVPYVVYCRSGNRSGRTVDIMADLGFTEVYDVDGGVVAWAGAGLPLER